MKTLKSTISCLQFCSLGRFYNYASYSNNEGYEIDNLYVSVTTPPTPTEVVTQIINDDFSYSDGLALNWANNWAELNNPTR